MNFTLNKTIGKTKFNINDTFKYRNDKGEICDGLVKGIRIDINKFGYVFISYAYTEYEDTYEGIIEKYNLPYPYIEEDQIILNHDN